MAQMTIRDTDVYLDNERYLGFDAPQYAQAFALGWNEALTESGQISDVGCTHPTDQDWNEVYDAGRNARIKRDAPDVD